MVESPKGITAISPGDRIAQLVILPSLHDKHPARDIKRGDKGFGSTGTDLAFLSLDLDRRPTLQLTINGIKITGLLDTGADKSIIASKDWPRGWPIQLSSHTLQGLGYAKAPNVSATLLNWQDTEGHSGVIQPYILELPVSLWGRDLMKDMGFKLSNDYSEKVQALMKDMGCHPDFGLDKHLQGRKDPIIAKPRKPRQGLGFS
ncbi:endogenous retrovirus group K member 7 Pro protein-like [Microtus ochrogaster]|uniref:human endogenous retrovirus K endopeptidase n=1 Tax=Microtus ochrogaster TaxID=79684 RepID=A0ABM1AUR5_MICOH|nr:endogenous retrovirus group K member 7 Pro protein-like [Microtus ochrogaster]